MSNIDRSSFAEPEAMAADLTAARIRRSDREIGKEEAPDCLFTFANFPTTEYLAPVLSVAVVDGVEGAIRHIRKYGSGHTDAIVVEDKKAENAFTASFLDAADKARWIAKLNELAGS